MAQAVCGAGRDARLRPLIPLIPHVRGDARRGAAGRNAALAGLEDGLAHGQAVAAMSHHLLGRSAALGLGLTPRTAWLGSRR